MSKVTLGLIQTHADASAGQNLSRTINLIAQAAKRGAQIVCTQELFTSQYFCQSEDHANFALAESIPHGPTTQALCETAFQHGTVIIGSLFEKRAAGVYHNTAVVIDADGQYLGSYRKMHIPDDPLYYEKFYFTPGDLGYRAWPTRFGKIGVLICWDQWFPEAARLSVLSGAEILFYATAIGWHPSEKKAFGEKQHSSWEIIQRSHAVANGCYVAAVNRVGHEAPAGGDGIEFYGRSFLAGPDGAIIARACTGSEEVLLAEVELNRVEEVRTHWPFLRDRRIDSYAGLQQRLLDQ